jgi:small-conductance mechanosensitive channel/cell division septum initiation protein DivIVA
MSTRRIAETIGSHEKTKLLRRARASRRVTHWSLLSLAALIFVAAANVPASQSQTPKAQPKSQATPATKSAQSATPPAIPPAASPSQLDRDAILHHLNEVITWYRDVTSKVKPAGLPSDAIYQDNTRSLASEAVRLAFQSARAEAAIISAMNKSDKSAGSDSAQANNAQPTQQQNLAQTAAKIAAQIDDTQTKLDAVNKQIESAPRSKQKDLLTQLDRLQGLLTLNKALQDTIQKMASFVGGATESAEGLEGSIDQLAHSVPEVVGDETTKKSGTAATAAAAATAASAKPTVNSAPSGLIGQSLTLFDQMQTMHQIEQMADETSKMRATADNVRKPLRDILVATIKQGRDLANQAQAPPNAGGSASPASPDSTTQAFQEITARFKELAAATLPLSQEIVVLDESRTNLEEWRKSIRTESEYELRGVLTRVLGIALALAAVLILSEVWRRLVFRYVHEARRRRQFLLMRRFVVGFLIGLVLIMGFVSEFSSLATFAGFVTAGIAVGLQAILLSIAAYFFVIGRYGIRVGDRISIAGVTGDVIDIGLVRFYLMELAGTGIELYPTGRVVMFSNSVLFQAGTPLFKQLPGTEYAWHEVAVALTPESNYKLVAEKLNSIVETIFEKYRSVIESQLGGTERRLEVSLSTPKPESRLQFTDAAGLEFVVRYPVDIRRAAEIDDNVTRSILDTLASTPDLKTSVSGPPKIRAAIKG